jgi:hypothetical protein
MIVELILPSILGLVARVRTHHKRQVKLLAKRKNIINVVAHLLDKRVQFIAPVSWLY